MRQALLLVWVLSLSGCGGDDPPTSGNNPEETAALGPGERPARTVAAQGVPLDRPARPAAQAHRERAVPPAAGARPEPAAAEAAARLATARGVPRRPLICPASTATASARTSRASFPGRSLCGRDQHDCNDRRSCARADARAGRHATAVTIGATTGSPWFRSTTTRGSCRSSDWSAIDRRCSKST